MKKNTIEQSTYYVYLDLINSLLINYKEYDLCNKQLHNLSPKVFQEYLNSLAEKYSRASILKIWQLIKQCVTYGETQNELNTNLLVMVDKTTKTETSKRIIPLPARGMEMIKYFDEFNPNHKPDDLVCLTSNKTKISRRNINRTLDGMCRDAGEC